MPAGAAACPYCNHLHDTEFAVDDTKEWKSGSIHHGAVCQNFDCGKRFLIVKA